MMKRLTALVVLLIPVFLAAFGIKLMRDMVFGILQAPIPSLLIQFLLGLILFIIGLGFISGFVLYRDRKENKVKIRFTRRKKVQKEEIGS